MSNIATVDELLVSLRSKNVFFEPLRGNLGDDLIVLGIQEQLRRHKIQLVESPAAADHILIKGGGAFLDCYEKLVDEVAALMKSHPGTPTSILPTSYNYNIRPLSELVGPRTASLKIFAREKYSYDLLAKQNSPEFFDLQIDHDSAFHLNNTALLENLRKQKKQKHVLIVERIDAESLSDELFSNSAGNSSPKPANGLIAGLKRQLPKKIKQSIRRKIELPKARAKARERGFYNVAKEFIYDRHPEFKNLPVEAFDVSQPSCISFEQFGTVIASSAAVYTTRLHVGILSGMLGIPTYLVPGVYHKIRGIREHSMSEMQHVQLV